MGIRAFTSSIANVSPQLALLLHDAGTRGDSVALQRMMTDYVVPLYAMRARRKGHEVTVMKELMTMLGLEEDPCGRRSFHFVPTNSKSCDCRFRCGRKSQERRSP